MEFDEELVRIEPPAVCDVEQVVVVDDEQITAPTPMMMPNAASAVRISFFASALPATRLKTNGPICQTPPEVSESRRVPAATVKDTRGGAAFRVFFRQHAAEAQHVVYPVARPCTGID